MADVELEALVEGDAEEEQEHDSDHRENGLPLRGHLMNPLRPSKARSQVGIDAGTRPPVGGASMLIQEGVRPRL